MAKKYGDPVVTLRMPRELIAGAQMAAAQMHTNVSGYIRELIRDDLDDKHIAVRPDPIDGQIDLDEIDA